MNNKYKMFMIFSIVVLVITIIVSTTYAYYVWTTEGSNVTKIVFGVNTATVTFDGGSDITGNLKPVSNKNKGLSKTIKVKANASGLVFNLYLDMTSLDTNLKHESFKYELYKGTTKVKEGDFSSTYLNSNTTTCTKNNTTHITLLTNESISTSNTEYTLYIWVDGANYTNPSTMMNKSFLFKLHADGEGAVVKAPPTASEIISELYNNATKTSVPNNNIPYQYDTTNSLMADTAGNIRYYGANPNNYIYFNCSDYTNQSSSTCETWRIIGIFDGKVKIIRNESIGSLAWDQDKNIDSSKTTYDNDWSTSSLKVLLNEKYYNGNTSGTITYYSGVSTSITAATLNMANIGIKNDTTRNMIAEATWNLGGWNSFSVYPNQIYNYERGTEAYSEERPTTWAGKVTLAYPSDYGYAADLSKCNQTLYDYDNSTCIANNWMKSVLGTSSGCWLLTPHSGSSTNAWYVRSSGNLRQSSLVFAAAGVAPVLYLSSELSIASGDGSSSNPYKLSV